MLKKTKIIFIVLVFIIAEIVLLSLASKQDFCFEAGYTLKEFARLNDVKPGKIKHELEMPDVRGRATLSELGIDQDRALHVLSHVKGRFEAEKRVLVQTIFALFAAAIIFLLCKNKMNSVVKTVLLLISITCFGFLLGKSYNPMTGMVKFIKGIAGIEPNIAAWGLVFVCFLLLTVIGTKVVCGWICPFGAIQELIYKIPGLGKFKTKYKIPFWLANSIRGLIFLVCITGLLLNLFGLREQGRVIYHVINPFNLFELNFSLVSIPVYIGIMLIAAYLFYRPHCYLVCPFGFFSWLVEKISVFKVRIDRGKCTDCGACIKACPGLAMKGIYEGKLLSADCFSCGECLDSCKFDALSYSCDNSKD